MSTKSYYLYKKQLSYDGTSWIDVQPNEYSVSGDTNDPMPLVVKEEHDAACGAMPPIYQWVDTEDTICVYDGHDYSQDYLTIESLDDNNTIYWRASNSANTKTISASTDNGQTWTAVTSSNEGSGTTIVTLNTGDKVWLKGTNPTYSVLIETGNHTSAQTYNNICARRLFKVYGNIMSLVSGDSFVNATELSGEYTFDSLFFARNNIVDKLASVENLILPATTLTKGCYSGMFKGCRNLTTTPELPATTLTQYCYGGMFAQCTSLTTAPQLPATTLAIDCYNSMFWGCTSLTTAELPATTLAYSCYAYMFKGCTSLTTAPELPATTLAGDCYYEMFQNCTSLNYIKCLATNISAIACTISWLDGVSSSGTFVKAANMNDWSTGVDGIPNNWTIQNA